MVRPAVLLLALAGARLCAAGEPSEIGAIKRLVIEQAGLSEHSDDYAAQTCKHFKLKPSQVRKFFEHAVVVESRVHTQERYSPCYAVGTADLDNGARASWRIYSGRTAIVDLEGGRSVVLYCKACRWEDPFEGSYSPDSSAHETRPSQTTRRSQHG